MASSTSSRSTLTITPSTMSPSLKYLMVWSIAARKSSAVPMSLTAIWGVLSGGTWVEVMWSSAPDGGCVGTGSPGLQADHGEVHGRPAEETARAGQTTPQTSGVIPMVRTPGEPVHHGSGPAVRPAACHDRRVMD